MKKLLLSLSFSFVALALSAQMTGNFQQSINFAEPDYTFTRTLYYHVPASYDSTQQYKLVIGFRGGPHRDAGQFRDQLAFLSDSIGAIVICPENISHFNSQEGLTKQLFQYTLDTVTAQYNIDPEFVYLTGLSFGGRHATIVSMDTDNGPIPNLRGVIPFAAGSNSQLEPDYGDIANFPPACICIGLNDNANFLNVSRTIHNAIQNNNGVSLLNEVPGVGHTVAFPTYPAEMMECFNFIEAQYTNTSINDEQLANRIQLFPNPAQQSVRLHAPANIAIEQVDILDNLGKVVLHHIEARTSINVASLSSGIYTIRILTSESVALKRFVKE
ncbi:MAG: T9SS type A sorting domain-containing protein [Bacteroidia bacterium]